MFLILSSTYARSISKLLPDGLMPVSRPVAQAVPESGRKTREWLLWVYSVEKLFFHRRWKNLRRYEARSALQARGIHERVDVTM
jgi:hypothetical protein